MGLLEGKVALISGVARGQGRSHAVRLAQEGADIIGFDVCEQIGTVTYPLASSEDLAETVRLVEGMGRRVVARQADVRDAAAVRAVVVDGVAELGRLDVVCANAGIMIGATKPPDPVAAFRDTIDVNLTGVWNTIEAALPSLRAHGEGGSIVITSSTAGYKAAIWSDGAGGYAYTASKHAVVGLMRRYALLFAHERIRVNTVHPTGVDTEMIAGFGKELNEFLTSLPEGSPKWGETLGNPMPVSVIEPADVSNVIVWLASDHARYVTGVMLPVDAGVSVR